MLPEAVLSVPGGIAMVADIVKNQVDFTTLQTLAPKLNSFNPNEDVSTDRKSFDDMIQEVRQTKEKPVEKTESSEKKDAPVENEKVQEPQKDKSAENVKTEENQKVEEKTSDEAEKKPEKGEKSAEKISPKQKNQPVETKNLKKSDNVKVQKEEKSSKKTEISFNDLEKLLENARNLTANEDEKAALTVEDMKNLLDENQEELSAAVNVSEQIIQAQNVDFDKNPQLSENIFNSDEEIDLTELNVKGKTFSLDKDGKITVKDLRSDDVQENKSEKESKPELKVTDVKFDGKNNAEMTMEVASNVQQNLVSSNDQTASAAGSNFQAMLANQIQENAGEFVKAGNIVLKDNDVGSIKLILKPEQLGNVKIDLQISDKNITGKIIVQSQEAYDAFKQSAETLRQAFIDSGFESAGLDLSFAGQNSGNQHMADQDNPAKSFAMARSYGDLTETGSSEDYIEEEILENSRRNSVNIVA